MRAARARLETEHQEAARLHRERLPTLRANEEQFRVAEEKKAAVLAAFEKMRAEGREVRCVGAIKLLTATQVQKQLALRHFLDKLSVKRSGKAAELKPLLEAAVAAEVAARAAAGGAAEPTADAEIASSRRSPSRPQRRPRPSRLANLTPRMRRCQQTRHLTSPWTPLTRRERICSAVCTYSQHVFTAP